MPQAYAYSEQHDRNVTLDEAHDLYFAQPESERKRFVFRCGDPRCRAMLKPLVVGALYDKEDIEGEKLRSPYYREQSGHPHIDSCTWINEKGPVEKDKSVSGDPTPSGSALAELGLVFKIKSSNAGGPAAPVMPRPAQDPEPYIDIDVEPAGEGDTPARPETSKFMAIVANRYLRYTDEQRRRTPLSLEGITKGEFYSVCMPISGFHPFYQKERIYHGKATVTELNNVFLIRFLKKMDPEGNRNQRTTSAEIKLLKRWLDENDRTLAEILHEVAEAKTLTWCFFYTQTTCETKGEVARFTVEDSAHVAVIGENEIKSIHAYPE